MQKTAGVTPEAAIPHVTVVRSPACHLCDNAVQTLNRLGGTIPLAVEILDIHSDEGARLVAEHRPPMSPLVLLDGALVSSGRLRVSYLLDLLRERGHDVSLAAVS